MPNAFYTDTYTNLFSKCGYAQEEIDARLHELMYEITESPENRFYFREGADLGYIVDTGNNDVRTEGMSYIMMAFVQLNMKEDFDRTWKWAKTYMYQTEGGNRGYFAWSCARDGTKNAQGPAPDGEEYFALALFFASHRWGDGEGIFKYSQEARDLLSDCIHKPRYDGDGDPMWDPQTKQIKFVPNCDFTDTSYHLPHFYELFALWSNEEDRTFWKAAAQASRDHIKSACHPVTGLAPEYAFYDGTPNQHKNNRHLYYSDAYRVAANIGLNYEWFANNEDEYLTTIADNIQNFFFDTVAGNDDMVYELDGRIVPCTKALHPVAIIATNAQASLAAKGEYKRAAIEKFWRTPPRTGDRRYYDNCLYLFAFLALSGNYKIYKPQ